MTAVNAASMNFFSGRFGYFVVQKEFPVTSFTAPVLAGKQKILFLKTPVAITKF